MPRRPKPASNPDWIAATARQRAEELGATAYALSQRCEGVSADAISRFFTGKTALGSAALGKVLRVLGLTLTPVPGAEKEFRKKAATVID